MASALVNNVGIVAPEGFLDLPTSAAASYSYGWLSPRISFSIDVDDDDKSEFPATAYSLEKPAAVKSLSFPPAAGKAAEDADLGSPGRDLVVDFEFRRLDDPAAMLPADELFSGGKLVPRQVASVRSPPMAVTLLPAAASAVEALSLETRKLGRGAEVSGSDACATFKPKAPRCSSRWRELLGLKKAAQNGGAASKIDVQMSSSSSSSSVAVAARSKSPSGRSLKHFIHRECRSSSIDSSVSLPFLRDADAESVSICSRLSLSSSPSSGTEQEGLPRLSLDSHRPRRVSASQGRNPLSVRLTPTPSSSVDPSPGPNQLPDHPHHRSMPAASGAVAAVANGRIGSSPTRRVPNESVPIPARGASVESPRMNSSGKVVFQNLERSSSSPSTFNGGPRVKHRSMERSYSANVVRVTPVLNVPGIPVCSLRRSSKAGSVFGFGHLFSSPPKKDSGAGRGGGSGAGRCVRTVRS